MNQQIIDRSRVKKYFKGKHWGPIILAIIGFVTIAFIIGIFLIIGAIVWGLIIKFSYDKEGEQETDRIVAVEIDSAKKRALDKLNLITEQIENVDPVIIVGPSYEPVSPTTAIASMGGKYGSIAKSAMSKNSDDPIFISKFGSDSKVRYSLLELNVYMFGVTQMYIYYIHVDITTGLIFAEGTYEYFYKDIVGMCSHQETEKVLDIKKKKFVRRLREKFVVYTSGCSHSAWMKSDLNASSLDKQFMAMRNLVRDKKEEK